MKEYVNCVIEKCVDSVKKVSSEELGLENSIGVMIFVCGNGNRMYVSNFCECVLGMFFGGVFLCSEIVFFVKGCVSNVLLYMSMIGIYRKCKKSVSM